MQKNYLLFFISLLFTSCGFDIADNQRLSFTGTITDESGNPIPEIPVFLQGSDEKGPIPFTYLQGYILGEGFTDNLGEFQVVSLKTTTNNLHINRSVEGLYQGVGSTSNPFTSLSYINVPGSLDMGSMALRKRAELSFKIHKTTASNDTLFWYLSYTHPYCNIVYNHGFVDQEKSSCYENFANDSLNIQTPVAPSFEKEYRTIINGTAEFNYRINDGSGQTILFNIDEIQETYVFEY